MLDDLVLEPVKQIVNPTDDAIITDSLLCGAESKTKIHMFIIQHPEHAKRLISPNSQNYLESGNDDASNSNLTGGENSAIDDLLAGFDSEVTTSESNSEIDALLNVTGGT